MINAHKGMTISIARPSGYWIFYVVFRAKSFTSCPVSKETEAMVTIRDLDELSHCSLEMASVGQQAQAVLVFLQAEPWVLYCSLFIILICIFPSESLGKPN